MAAIGQLDHDVRAVRAGIDAVFADGIAVEAASALTAGAGGHLQDALLGNRISLGRISLLGNFIRVRLADDGLRKRGGVRNALDNGSGASVRIACRPDVFHVGLEGRALAAHFDAVFGHELRVDLLADGRDDQIARDFKRFAGGDGAAAAGCIGLAELHLIADQLAVLLLDGSRQLDQLHALVDGKLQLMLIGGHFLLRAAVDDGGGGRAHALGDAGCVHGGVACADDDHMALKARLDLLLHFLHPADDALDIAGDAEFARLPCAGGHQDVGVAQLLELFHARSRCVALDFDAKALHERNVLVKRFVGDAERGNDIARHAAELRFALEDRGFHAAAGEEVGSCNAGRAAADDRGLLAGQLRGRLHGRHERAVAVLRCDELGVADVDGFVIEVARALVLAAVRADRAGQERQRVLFRDQLQRRAVQSAADKLHVLRNVLMDGAAALAGCGEAVDEGHLVLTLAGRQGLDGLEVMEVAVAGGGHIADRGGIRAIERVIRQLFRLFDHLGQTVVSAGLQDGGRDGDGPDACGKQLVAVEEFRAAREGNAHFAVKLTADAAAHLNGQREEAAAGHVHFGAGQLVPGGVDGEGVGELEAEFQAPGVCQRLQALEHRHGVGPLQILVEVVLVEDDVVIAHGVEDGAGGLVAEDGRVALDEGVQALFGQEIGRDALDLLRRTAMERGNRDAAADARGDGGDEVLFLREQLGQNGEAFLELRGVRRVHHVVDVAVDLLALDALEIIADRHVEHEAVRGAEAVDLGPDFERAPGLDILILRLRDFELGRPFLVVALVSGQNARTRHAAGQLFAVHFLHRLDLEEAGAGKIRSDDVLCQLAVGACCRAERCLDRLAEDGERLAGGIIRRVHAEDLTLAGVFGDDPVHQRLERDRIHFFRHVITS